MGKKTFILSMCSLLALPLPAADTDLAATTGGNEGFVRANSSGDLVFSPAGTERMRITSGGNVGIGTTAPGSHKLNVNGNFNGVNGIFVDNLVADLPSFQMGEASFIDIPGSSKAVFLPAGTAVIFWTLSGYGESANTCWRVRPMIGTVTPADGVSVTVNPASSHQTYSGSWTTAVAEGGVMVKLQVRLESGGRFMTDGNDQVTWTIIVFRS